MRDLIDHTKLVAGQRVRTVRPVENYPTILCPVGETGTVARIEADSVWVKLDRHFPELDEWNNELQIYDWSGQDGAEGLPDHFVEVMP